MAIDWQLLNGKTRENRALNITTDPEQTIFEVVFSGLRVNLSEVLDGAPAGGVASVTIYADTLVVDMPSFDGRGAVIVARSIDVSALQGKPLQVRKPADDTAVIQVLAGQVTGGTLALAPAGSTAAGYSVPVGQSPLQSVLYFLKPDGTFTTQVSAAAADLDDLVARPLALSALRASATAATWLASSDDAESTVTAQSMLSWVVACVRSLGSATPSDYAELYNQALALLVTLNVAPGAHFVPVLSRDAYKGQIDALLGAQQAYEDTLHSLDISTDIKAALQSVSGTLAGVAQDEAVPLQTQLAQITGNIAAIREAIAELQLQYMIQEGHCSTLFAIMRAKIRAAQAVQFFEATLTATLMPYMLAASVATKSGVGQTLAAFKDALRKAGESIQTLNAGPSGSRALLDQAQALQDMQSQMVTSYVAGATLWSDAKNNTHTDLPQQLAAIRLDPNLSWNSYTIAAEAELTSVKESIGGGTDSGPAQDAANQYLASLKILAEYGKAIGAKIVALSGQLARGTVVMAQIAAARNVKARWEQLQAQAKSDAEKLALAKSLLQARISAIRRSVYVAWTYYRDAYFYLYFQKPPVSVNTDMTAAQMRDAFATVSLWIARLLGDSPDGQTVHLPAENVDIAFEFDVVPSGAAVQPSTNVALLSARNGNQPAMLTWSIPLGIDQLRGVLPSGGNVAVWIQSASFFIDGMTANNRGNVLAAVRTSGSYQNGFGPSKAYSFVTKGMSGDYAYRAADRSVYNAWSINTAVYMTPSPYTQWTMAFDPDGGDPSAATKLRMKLKVAYRAQA